MKQNRLKDNLLGVLSQDERTDLVRGLDQHNSGKYFACHETLEDIWMDKTGDLRRYLQGLIHVTVGFYHLGDSNFTGASRQLNKAYIKIADFAIAPTGIDNRRLLDDIDTWLKNIEILRTSDKSADFGHFPKIVYDCELLVPTVTGQA